MGESGDHAATLSHEPGVRGKGRLDDSIAGAWYELTITGDDQTGFVVSLATRRLICHRGVSGNLCV